MTTNPQLPNHLIRELMNTICFKNSGEAMVRLALSGKMPFSVFEYIFENHVVASTSLYRVSLESKRGFSFFCLKFVTKGAKRLAIRFVRELRLHEAPLSKRLPFKNIIELDILRGYNKLFNRILKSLTHLEVLKLDFDFPTFDDFFNEVRAGNVSLTKLRKLDISLNFDDFLKIMSTTPLFPLPEDVTFRFYLTNSVPDRCYVPLQTFPKVKHLVFDIWQRIEITSALLHHISTVANCFNGLETAKIEFYNISDLTKNTFAEVVEFHELLRNTHFSFPVEVDYEDHVSLVYPGGPKNLYEQLKSIGFKKESVGFKKHWNGDAFFVLKKEFGNVKLNLRIRHFQGLSV